MSVIERQRGVFGNPFQRNDSPCFWDDQDRRNPHGISCYKSPHPAALLGTLYFIPISVNYSAYKSSF